MVSEAHPINEPTQENERSTAGIFQYSSRANLKQFFAEHPFQPLDDLPFDARLYERKIMNDSVLKHMEDKVKPLAGKTRSK